MLNNKKWWKASIIRAIKTFGETMASCITLGLSLGENAWMLYISTAFVSVVYSLLTSIAGLPELDGAKRNWWAAAAIRGLKTFAQTVASFITVGAIASEINWVFALSSGAVAFVYSMMVSIAGLPEVQEEE